MRSSYPNITKNRAFCYIFSIDDLKILFKPLLTSWTNQGQTRKLKTLYPTSTPPPPHPQPTLMGCSGTKNKQGKGKMKKQNGNETKHGSLREKKIILKSIARNIWGMVWRIGLLKSSRQLPNVKVNLRSRRLEVVGTRKNGCARRHACLPRARLFSLSPTSSKRLLRSLR